MNLPRQFAAVWAVDFEFSAPPGERPAPLCVVARELRTGRLVRSWLTGGAQDRPPYPIGPEVLFVAFYASAELGCHLALGWPFPLRVLDLYAEFRCLTAGLVAPFGHSLLGALAAFGLDGIGAADKQSMRDMVIRGGPFTEAERLALLDYCQTDVDALAKLLPKMLPRIDLPRALVRGRYFAAAARMEATGVPLDAEALASLRGGWDRIKRQLIVETDRSFGVFEPAGRVLDPNTRLGAAILTESREWDIDPHVLADAVDDEWQRERELRAGRIEAIRAAQQATKLTPARINRWEDAGHDYASWPGLDTQARELAGLYPALGIGREFCLDDDFDDTDHAALLWAVLRAGEPTLPAKHNPALLRRVAELVAGSAPTAYAGPLRFSSARFADYLARQRIPWPRLPSDALALDDDTFREMAKAYPVEIGPIRELRHTLGQLRLNELAVGADGRNRLMLSAFGSKTGRNQPSNSKFIFGPSCWLRSLIKPQRGRAVAYCDWSQQELAIAAALSEDPRMMDAYRSGDFYLTFAKMAGAVPPDATKQSHGRERDQFKTVALGVLYGLGTDGLARKLALPMYQGRELLRLHQKTFRRFWEWSDAVEMEAMLSGRLQATFGWTIRVGPDANPRSLRNFPMQANGAEMMRLACCLATERGIAVCAPVHDALLVEGPADEIEAVVAETQRAMEEASEFVLPGFPLRTDSKIVRYPDRYTDPRGVQMWETVSRLLAALETPSTDAGTPTSLRAATNGNKRQASKPPTAARTPPTEYPSARVPKPSEAARSRECSERQ
ncbi:MAG: DNA polymerase [Gemmataceae bacterium]